ncbi:MAG: GNAT family N-acetyltransferase [Acidiferrobacterales bacterium]|nr:GNAT family N-acetyltransferase [Acidiferrobacterales bacterium]
MICSKDYTKQQIEAWAPDDYDKSAVQSKFDQLNPFVAKIKSNIVGYADLQSDGLIDHFFVHGEYQSKGIGELLMQSILKKGKDKQQLYSHVSMTAKPFFENYGFSLKEVQEVEIRGCKMNNNLMCREQTL